MNNRRGFTLVELLVTITIIVVLAGLMFVSGRWALVTARTASCASNLRQGAQALALYASDHNDLFPPFFVIGEPVGVPDVYPEGEAAFVEAIGRYGWSEGVRFCPLDRFSRKDVHCELATNHLHTSYLLALEVHVLGSLHRVGNAWRFSPSLVDEPSRMPLLQSKSWVTGPDPNDGGRRKRWTAHGDRTNIVFLDGHTRLVRHYNPDD